MKKLNDGVDALFSSPKWMNICRIVFLIVIVLVLADYSVRMIKGRGDIDVFLHASNQVLSGNDIYATPISNGLYYIYLPLFAVLFTPAAMMPREIAIVLWAVFNVILIGWIIYAFYEAMTGKSLSELEAKTRWTVCFFSVLLTADFILPHLRYGQTNILVMAMAVFALQLMERKQDAGAGIILGISAVIKILTAPVIAWFFFRQKFKVIAGAFIGTFAGLLLPGFFLGFERNWQYLQFWVEKIALYSDLRNHAVGFVNNVSLQAVMYRLFSNTAAFEYRGKQYYLTIFPVEDSALHLIGRLLVLAIIAALLIYWIKYRKSSVLISHWGGVALSFALAPLFTTVAEKYHFVLLLPAYIYAIHVWYSLKLRDKWFRGLVIASFVFTTLTAKLFWGEFLSKVFFAAGCISWGTVLLAAAIFRAASCFRNRDLDNQTL